MFSEAEEGKKVVEKMFDIWNQGGDWNPGGSAPTFQDYLIVLAFKNDEPTSRLSISDGFLNPWLYDWLLKHDPSPCEEYNMATLPIANPGPIQC